MTLSDTSSFEQKNGGEAPADAPFAQQAKQAANELKEKASAFAESVTDTAQQEAGEASAAAREIFEDATDRVKSAVSEQKNAGADYLDIVARAVHRAAREFEPDVPQAAHYIRRAGGQLGEVAKAVRQRDIRELVTEVEEAARREPALFFGGAVLLGFAAVRFLKSAPPKSIIAQAAG
jgi:hypothetical protein